METGMAMGTPKSTRKEQEICRKEVDISIQEERVEREKERAKKGNTGQKYQHSSTKLGGLPGFQAHVEFKGLQKYSTQSP